MFLGEIWRIDFQISKLIFDFLCIKIKYGIHLTTVCNFGCRCPLDWIHERGAGEFPGQKLF